MDIRNWFSPKNSTTSKDKQSKPEASSSKLKKSNEKPAKKRRIIESDSDEEPIPKLESNDLSNKKESPKKKSSKNTDKVAAEKKKEVSVSDFFGSKPIARTQMKEAPQKKKMKEEKVHEDVDFEATLKQLDGKQLPKKKDIKDKVDTKSESAKGKVKETSSKAEMKTSEDKIKCSIPNGTKGKGSGKRKSKNDSSIEMEITPPVKTPPKPEVKLEKPALKKPRASAGNYASYLHREGPKALGTKDIPEGEEDCFAGLTFIITGVLESIERDEAKDLIEKYGGKVMTTLSKNTKYIVIGRDAGASKLEKAEKLGTKQVDEDGLFDLIRTLPGKGPIKKPKQSPSPSVVKKESPKTAASKKAMDIEDEFEMDCDDSFLIEESFEDDKKEVLANKEPAKKISPLKENKVEKESQKNVSPIKTVPASSKLDAKSEGPITSMWVDKYKPTSLKQIIGQQGDKSNAKKLYHWLINWKKSRRLNKKAIPGRFNPADDGSAYKAALLSGPPGVGKTTTAHLVCKEASYDHFELNASDTRSKKSLQQVVSQLLGNQTLADCFKDDSGKVSSNHVIIMDEVDGMAGNEDRGGVAELISFIKASKVPIMCICNDRNHPKIRSLANYCFDLRFQKPRVEQIKAAMLTIACREKIQVSQDVLQDIIVASNQDLRQVLHNMSMWSANSKTLASAQTKCDIGKGTKHIKMGPFDVLREVFAIGNNPKATIMDKSDLFFHDYSIAPLFVQENYVHVMPTAAEGNKHKHLRLLSEAADSICIGDVIDKQIRSQMSWSLLPTQAIFASVLPGQLMRGNLRQMINFPSWLGKNSTRSYMDRVLQELHKHMRMRISGNKTDVALEYLPLLKRALTKPLIEKETEGVPEVLRTMEQYFLLREDFDSVIDLSLWPNQTDPRTKIQTKVKSAFTRAYNKESGKNPYAVTNVKKKKASAKDQEGELNDDEAIESEEEEDDSIEKDAMIKVKKPSKKGAPDASEPSTSKGKQKNASKRGGKSK